MGASGAVAKEWNFRDRQACALPQQRRKVRDDFARARPSPWSQTLPRVPGEMALHVLAYNLTRVINIVGSRLLIAAIRA
jgi:hypothetical protein